VNAALEQAPEITFRQAAAGDRRAVKKLLVSQRLPVAGLPPDLTGFLVAEAEGHVIGTIGLERWGAYGLLRSAAVADGWKGRGVGRRLVGLLLESDAATALRALYLLTTTADRYFPAFGFVATTRAAVPDELRQSVEFRGACPETAVVMMRSARGA
jgi:amino-acid N-acetyltransferase